MNRRLYAIHRWLSLLAALQLAAWATSGLIFALLPERSVTSPSVAGVHELPLNTVEVVTPRAILMALDEEQRARVRRLELHNDGDRMLWVARDADGWAARFDARTGAPAPVTEREARQIASRDQEGRPHARWTERIEANPPVEYRDRPLPAYRVLLDDPLATVVYVDAQTGEVTARRTATWRVYDFFWSLHIMDYGDRTDYRHPLLIGFAALADLTVISGLVLWTLRIVRRLSKRNKAPS